MSLLGVLGFWFWQRPLILAVCFLVNFLAQMLNTLKEMLYLKTLYLIFALYVFETNFKISFEKLIYFCESRYSREPAHLISLNPLWFFACCAHKLEQLLSSCPNLIVFYLRIRQNLFKTSLKVSKSWLFSDYTESTSNNTAFYIFI